MKKKICAVLVLICLLCGITVYANTDKADEGVIQTASDVITVDGSEVSQVVDFLDFEEYNPDFQLIRLDQTFGKVSQNDDKAYVKSGKYSAKVQPLGGYSSETKPGFYYPLYSEMAGFDYMDIRNWACVSIQVYNAQDDVRNMEVSMVTSVGSIYVYSTSGEQNYTLKPGWNDIVYYPNLDMLNIAYDVENMQGICFSFDNAGTRHLKDAPVYYFDDVQLYLYDEYRECESQMEFTRNEETGVYEIMGFDKDFHEYSYYLDIPKEKLTPDVEIVDGETEGITATEGNKMLKLTLHPGDVHMQSYPKFCIPEKLIQASGFNEIPKDERENYRFVFDVYCADRDMNLVFEFYTSGLNGCYKPGNHVNFTASDEWQEAIFDFSVFAEKSYEHIANPGEFRIVWAEYPADWGDLVIYIDNIRYEKIQ